MAPRNASKKQAEQAAPAGEDLEFEQETSDPKAISKDMEKNVRTARIEMNAHHADIHRALHLVC